jgi:KDO2-lipid IV(A) lauroyltransferase
MVTETRRRKPGFFGGEARSASSDTAVSVLGFLAPRYWRGWCLLGWLRLSALLPWRFSLALHKQLGRWLGRRSGKTARLVRQNLDLCLPELKPAERARLADEYFANMGAIVAELALAWFRSPVRLQSLFEVEGSEHLARAHTGGRGVILFSGHFTPLELCVIGLRDYIPRYALLYNKRRSRLLSEYQRRSRERYADESFQKHDVRGLLRSLKANSVVWFAGDEAHTGKSSALIPFFGQPAQTSIALSRIAKISGAAVVPVFFCRRDDDSGYRIRLAPALEDFPSGDAIADTSRLITILEDQIRECPAQYLWKQKRFRGKRPT